MEKGKELYCVMCGTNRWFKYEGRGNTYKLFKCTHCGAKQSTNLEEKTEPFVRNITSGGR